MCGIVGAVAKHPIAHLLLDGLRKLEYRGYDSAGMAILDADHEIHRLRVVGKVRELASALQQHPLHGTTGIAHTRWATHGAPCEKNAHPFVSHDEFALVHNGIIENHAALRNELKQSGYEFLSETDTETVVHLIHFHYQKNQDLLSAVTETVKSLKGAYAIALISKHHPGRLIAARHGSPLVVGLSEGENYVASDTLALLSYTQKFIYLEDHDIVDVNLEQVKIYQDNKVVERKVHTLSITSDATERGEYRHFMKKEIMEQAEAIAACLESRLSDHHPLPGIFGPETDALFLRIKHIQFVACGTSYHAALVAKYWFEALTAIPCSVEVASEFRYRDLAKPEESLFVTLSQSGETADTLAALRLAKTMDYLNTLAICNVPGSSMTREAGLHFLTRAGVEIGVASTKAFITQLTALLLLALAIRTRRLADDALTTELVAELKHLPALIKKVLQQDGAIAQWAKIFTDKQHALFIGRGDLYPIALEGALKMKEISYIHAEAYPCGELKHGPLALVDANMPVIATAPGGALFEKIQSNLQEVRARGGKLFVFTDQVHLFHDDVFSDTHIIAMPSVHAMLQPIIYTIPLQLLAYHVAVLKGTDVDQPRNLAKSVTVE